MDKSMIACLVVWGIFILSAIICNFFATVSEYKHFQDTILFDLLDDIEDFLEYLKKTARKEMDHYGFCDDLPLYRFMNTIEYLLKEAKKIHSAYFFYEGRLASIEKANELRRLLDSYELDFKFFVENYGHKFMAVFSSLAIAKAHDKKYGQLAFWLLDGDIQTDHQGFTRWRTELRRFEENFHSLMNFNKISCVKVLEIKLAEIEADILEIRDELEFAVVRLESILAIWDANMTGSIIPPDEIEVEIV